MAMICPKCGWHTHNPRRTVHTEWDGCLKYEWSVNHCEKMFCSGVSTSNKVVIADRHNWKNVHIVDKNTNATIRYATKCTRCGTERSDNSGN